MFYSIWKRNQRKKKRKNQLVILTFDVAHINSSFDKEKSFVFVVCLLHPITWKDSFLLNLNHN
jgi:hypothetical protein